LIIPQTFSHRFPPKQHYLFTDPIPKDQCSSRKWKGTGTRR